ncbi:hypothetical protein CH362_18675 [Leptospira saintgironsiae]|uniref:Uncharacterized protein n=1 Tax=Leptospira saintgironsiae TaxID=2023183 RepID=A0A2M9Y7I6_9LEPT|nr:hypothetical protein CH362_18675 [Leptospira saintgironsiae]
MIVILYNCNTAHNFRVGVTLRDRFATLAPGSATFRFVTRLAGQVSRQVLTDSRNVANPWSLYARLAKSTF